MLLSLHIKNLALIEEEEIEFGEHLNILTGETGAGKSVIIGSIMLALGGKADKEVIRSGCDTAIVELTFSVDKGSAYEVISDMDIPMDEDGIIIISRRITKTRSIYKANGISVTASQIRQISSELIDIHGQYEHQSLLKKSKQAEVLDGFAREKLDKILDRLKSAYDEYKAIEQEVASVDVDEQTRKRDMDFAVFSINELEAANLKSTEEEELDEIFRRLSNSRKIESSLGKAAAFTGAFGEEGASDLIGMALRELGDVAVYDKKLENLMNALGEADSLLEDFNREMSDYISDMEFDESYYSEVEERLLLIRNMKSKYGRTVEDCLDFLEKQKQLLDKYTNIEEYMSGLLKKKEAAYDKLLALCNEASGIRKKSAKELSQKLTESLIDLNFNRVTFSIDIMYNENHITSKGCDSVEYLMSMNPGEPVKPLAEVASGGELSRIMLALKTVLADKEETASLIFDEIDTGISGKTAWKVSEKMGRLSLRHQIICITHLPQIAAMADYHFLIEKEMKKDRTFTGIRQLDEEESNRELARMMGTEDISEAGIENAVEMKKRAIESKQLKP